MPVIDIFDILLGPVYILLIYLLAKYYINSQQTKESKSYFKYFIPGLMLKIGGGIFLCLIYTYYYEGGDTLNYYTSSVSMINILFNDGISAFTETIGAFYTKEFFSQYFNLENGTFNFNQGDMNAVAAVLYTIPLCILGFKNFIITTILLATISYYGLWKLYEIFIYFYPNAYKQFAYAILYIPSVIFWGSGILKDTYAFFGMCIVTYCFFKIFILKERKLKYIIALVFLSYVILSVKPYIFIALMPGCLIWGNFNRINNIRNNFIRIMALPFIITLLVGVISFIFIYLKDYLGEFQVDTILNKAVKTQQDLVREAYGKNSFNIGKFDATIPGIISKFPVAVNAALFRPYVWDTNNIVMLFSGIENLIILLLTIYIVLTIRLKVLSYMLQNPLLLFCIMFSLLFAFSVGLTTANYGALVRLKIPCIPFYLSGLIILLEMKKERRIQDDQLLIPTP